MRALSLALAAAALVTASPAVAQDSFGIERGSGQIICTDDADDNRNPNDPSFAIAALWPSARRPFRDRPPPIIVSQKRAVRSLPKRSQGIAETAQQGACRRYFQSALANTRIRAQAADHHRNVVS